MCFCQPLVLPPSVKDNLLDFGVRSATHTSSIIFVVVNSNPIEVRSCAVTQRSEITRSAFVYGKKTFGRYLISVLAVRLRNFFLAVGCLSWVFWWGEKAWKFNERTKVMGFRHTVLLVLYTDTNELLWNALLAEKGWERICSRHQRWPQPYKLQNHPVSRTSSRECLSYFLCMFYCAVGNQVMAHHRRKSVNGVGENWERKCNSGSESPGRAAEHFSFQSQNGKTSGGFRIRLASCLSYICIPSATHWQLL